MGIEGKNITYESHEDFDVKYLKNLMLDSILIKIKLFAHRTRLGRSMKARGMEICRVQMIGIV